MLFSIWREFRNTFVLESIYSFVCHTHSLVPQHFLSHPNSKILRNVYKIVEICFNFAIFIVRFACICIFFRRKAKTDEQKCFKGFLPPTSENFRRYGIIFYAPHVNRVQRINWTKHTAKYICAFVHRNILIAIKSRTKKRNPGIWVLTMSQVWLWV